MNVVVFQFNNTFSRPLVRSILNKIGARKVYNFWTLPVDYNQDKDEHTGFEVIEKYSEILNIFDPTLNTIDFSKLYPLDADILAKMAPYEGETKKIISRYPAISPRFIKDDLKGIRKLIDQWLCFTGDHFSSDCMSFYHVNYYYNRLVQYWNDFFANNKIDLVLSEFIPHGPIDYTAYRVAQTHGVPSVFGYFAHSTMFQYFMDNLEIGRETFPSLVSGGSNGQVTLHRTHEAEYKRLTTPANEQVLPWGGDLKKIELLKEELNQNEVEISSSAKQKYPSSYDLKDPRKRFYVRLFNAFLKIRFFKKYKFVSRQDKFYENKCVVPDYGNPYIYFPLHFQPESTSCPLGGVYENQVLIAQMLNYHIPDDWCIYIKEHVAPSDFSNRSLEVYEQFLSLKKVRFISKKVSTFKLIESCKAVCTITGTAGWEGLFKGKPCLFFGNHIAQFAPGMFRIKNNEDCKDAISRIKEGVAIDVSALRSYMKSMEAVTVPTSSERFVHIQKDISNEEWVSVLAEGYVRKINEILFAKNRGK